MFAVAGVTGHTGAATADALLRMGQKVRVFVRKEEQGEPWVRRHCEVAVLDLKDTEKLTASLKGMSGAFLLLPPMPGAEDLLAEQAALVTSMATAVKKSGLKTLVFLSSSGAQHAVGTGPVVALHRAEKALTNIAPSVTFLRAAYFLENWGQQLMPALETSELSFFGHSHLKFAQVGAHDIGLAAGQLLEEGAPGTRYVELGGKEPWSAENVAEVFTALLDQTIKAVDRPLDTAKDTFEKAGMSPANAALYAELYQGLARGLFHFARPTQVIHGKTSLYDALKTLV